jgi:hypothetical protein
MDRILDWGHIKKFVAERNPVEVSAGLLDDWFWTASTVYKDGKWIDDHGAYDHSYWATPGFKATMSNGDVIERVAWREMTDDDKARAKIESDKTREQIKELAAAIRSKRVQ